jgi:hypothetical protein
MEKAFDRCSLEFLEDGLAAIGKPSASARASSTTSSASPLLAYSRTRTRHTAHAPHIPDRLWSRAGMPPPPPLPPLLFLIIADPLMRLFNQNRNICGIVFRPETRPIAMKSPYSPALFAEDSTLILRTADIQDALRTLHPNLVRCNKQGVTRPQARGPSPRAPTPPSRAPRQQARAQPTRDPNTRSFATRHHHPRPRRPIGNEFDLDW